MDQILNYLVIYASETGKQETEHFPRLKVLGQCWREPSLRTVSQRADLILDWV